MGDEFSAINDILGECSIKLDLLISNVVIEEKLPLKNPKNPKQEAGYLYIQILWGEDNIDLLKKMDTSKRMMNWEQEITNQIASALKSRGLTIYNSYKLFDRTNSNRVSYEDLKEIVRGLL